MRWVTDRHHFDLSGSVSLSQQNELNRRIMRHTLLRSSSLANLYEEYDKLYDG